MAGAIAAAVVRELQLTVDPGNLQLRSTLKSTEAYDRGDYDTAMQFMKKAADQGDGDAALSMGVMYERGEGVPSDHAQAAVWYRKGAELGSGKHEIEVVVFDNAGNEQRHYEPISIRHSTPVALGPGSVDLESGDFTLGDKDVSMGTGLTVSRNYSSRPEAVPRTSC